MATIKDIQNGALHPLYTGLYGSSHDAEDQDRRYTTLSEEQMAALL